MLPSLFRNLLTLSDSVHKEFVDVSVICKFIILLPYLEDCERYVFSDRGIKSILEILEDKGWTQIVAGIVEPQAHG